MLRIPNFFSSLSATSVFIALLIPTVELLPVFLATF